MGDSSTVEQRTLTPLILVRIQVPQPFDFIDEFSIIGENICSGLQVGLHAIRITGGLLVGTTGLFAGMRPSDRVAVLLAALGTVTLPSSYIERAAPSARTRKHSAALAAPSDGGYLVRIASSTRNSGAGSGACGISLCNRRPRQPGRRQ